MNLYTISPFCFAGAVVDAEKRERRAARTAKLRRHWSSDEISSITWALMT
jgi:hypothetical protein